MRLLLQKPKKRRARRGFARACLRFSAGMTVAVVAVTFMLVLPLRWIDPPITAFILRERLTSDQRVYHHWVQWEDIASTLAISAVAAEDQKFPDHSGFDWAAIQQALAENRQARQTRGGSTISQQLAKNLFLWPAQNWIRKGAEAWFTVWIELLWPKRRIMEVYLNVAEFGPGVFGVGEASERLIGKLPSELTARDAAILVAVLPNPKRMSASSPSDYVRTRAEQIQTEVRRLGGPGYLTGM